MRAALLVLLLLAGCSGPAAPASDSSPPSSGPSEAPPVQPAASPPTPTTLAIDWVGHLGTEACVPSGPFACRPLPVGEAGNDTLPLGPGAWEVDAELTWAGQPGMDRLAFALRVVSPCGGGCRHWRTLAYAEGQSPLRLVGNATAGEGAEARLSVFQLSPFPAPLYGVVQAEQEFHVRGHARGQPGSQQA